MNKERCVCGQEIYTTGCTQKPWTSAKALAPSGNAGVQILAQSYLVQG